MGCDLRFVNSCLVSADLTQGLILPCAAFLGWRLDPAGPTAPCDTSALAAVHPLAPRDPGAAPRRLARGAGAPTSLFSRAPVGLEARA